MKNLILASFVSMMSVSAWAAAPSLSATPVSPVVITGNFLTPDGKIIYAPWFQTTYAISSDQPITLTSMYVETWLPNVDDSVMSYTVDLGQVSVDSSTPYSHAAYTENLSTPLGDYSGYGYKVFVQFNGWYGTPTAPTGRLVLTKTFQTQ
jgi:hypothetical protein